MAPQPQPASNHPTLRDSDSPATGNSSIAAHGDARIGAARDVVRTTCGREFAVGSLRLEHLAQPAARVSLSTRLLPQDAETFWASFTAREARRLAAYLLAHAAAAEAAEAAPPPGPSSSPSRSPSTS